MAILAASCVWADEGDAHEHEAHQHGLATLDIALEGDRLELAFESPAASVVGFEHAPRTPAQREARKRASQWLNDGQQLFGLAPAAGCRLLSAEVVEPGDSAEAKHQDYEARYAFQCAQPQHLQAVDVRLIERLVAGTKVRAQLISDDVQRSAELSAGRSTLPLRKQAGRGNR